MQANLDIRSKYLQNIPTFAVDPTPPTITRQFLSKEYGGHSQQLIQHMNHSRSKENPAIFPAQTYNPYLPTSIGAPGLMFTPRRRIISTGLRVFVKKGNAPVRHLFLGNYTTTCVGYLTKEEYAHHNPKVSGRIFRAFRLFRCICFAGPGQSTACRFYEKIHRVSSHSRPCTPPQEREAPHGPSCYRADSQGRSAKNQGRVRRPHGGRRAKCIASRRRGSFANAALQRG